MTPLLQNRSFVNKIFRHFMMLQQWMEHGHLENAHKIKTQLEALIEVAESDHCGSVGGFDKGQSGAERKNLGVRFKWLMKAHQLNIMETSFIDDDEREKVINAIEFVVAHNVN